MSTGVDLPYVGDILRGKYQLVRTLGEGGMAVVFEARQKDSGQRVAVKVLAPELAQDPEIVARFDREARALGRLRTRHVAHVVEVATTSSGVPFMVMDFLDGRDLGAELELRKQLPVEEAVDYTLQTCAAMEEAHRAGIVHRDLKPANLFLITEGAHRVVKVLDFGISKLVGESSKLTFAGAVLGTVIYMSPEQVRSSADVDCRADIWSLGVILFELLAGRAPFEGPGHTVADAIVSQDAPDIRSFTDVPEPVAAAIARMLRRDPEARFSDMRAVAAVLAPFVNPGSVGASAAAVLGAPPRRPVHASAGKTMPMNKLQQRTMPLGLVRPSASATPPSTPRFAQRSPQLLAEGVRSQQRPSDRGKVQSIVGAALGLLAAVGITLIGLTLMRKDATPPSIPTTTTAPVPAATTPPARWPEAGAPATAPTESPTHP